MSGDQPGTGEPDGEADPAADAAGGVTVEELRSGCPLLFADHIFFFFSWEFVFGKTWRCKCGKIRDRIW